MVRGFLRRLRGAALRRGDVYGDGRADGRRGADGGGAGSRAPDSRGRSDRVADGRRAEGRRAESHVSGGPADDSRTGGGLIGGGLIGGRQVGGRQVDDKPTGDGRTGNRQTDDKPTEDRRTGNRQTDDKPTEDRRTESRQTADGRTLDERTDGRQTTDGRTLDERTDGRQTTDGRTLDERTDGRQAGGGRTGGERAAPRGGAGTPAGRWTAAIRRTGTRTEDRAAAPPRDAGTPPGPRTAAVRRPAAPDGGRSGPPRRAGFRTGLRWKLSAAIALVGALVALALSLLVHNAARVSMLDNARDLADERVLIAQRTYELSGRLNFPNARIDDPGLPPELREKAEEGRRATFVSVRPGGAADIWAAVPLKDGHVMSLHTGFTDRSSDILEDLDQALVIGSITVVLGGSALGVLIGGQLSRRLRKAAAAANQVAAGETDVRVRDAIGGVVRDETDDLARAVDAMTETLQQRLEAERRVTADIAHELRTPVTGLLTAAGLLPPGRPTELVLDRAKAMRTLVEDVLEVARLDSASERAELQDIVLGEFVARRVAARGGDVTVRVLHESEVTTDPRRLERVLFNLLDNAARHGRPPIEVSVEGRVVRVRDHGPGFPAGLLAEGPSRFRTGAADRAGRGHGLGLTIAAGQARVMGARLTFHTVRPPGAPEDAPAEGAVAVLWLPEHAPTNTGSYPVLPDLSAGGG